jgi:hypothetical protein
MKLFSVVIAGAFATANAAEHYTPVGAPPICEVDAQGYTHVYYQDTLHPSFKCTHSGSTCACTLQHPTHHKGGCKQLESKAAGKLLDTGGDCTDSGKNTPAPTPAPTPAVWAGSDLAADVALMTDGATINLAAGTFAWTSEVSVWHKTLTLTGAGKGVTILDAGVAPGVAPRRFFTLNTYSGSTLVLRALTLRNGKASTSGSYLYGGAIFLKTGSTLDARDVEFKDNSAVYVRHPTPRRSPAAAARARARSRRRHSHAPTHLPLTRPHPPNRPLPLLAPAAPARATQGGAVDVQGGSTASFTSCDFTSNSADFVRANPRPPCSPAARARACSRRRRRSHAPPSPRPPARLRATQPPGGDGTWGGRGAVLFASWTANITFASTLPLNSFSGNTAKYPNNFGNCFTNNGGPTITTGSCS